MAGGLERRGCCGWPIGRWSRKEHGTVVEWFMACHLVVVQHEYGTRVWYPAVVPARLAVIDAGSRGRDLYFCRVVAAPPFFAVLLVCYLLERSLILQMPFLSAGICQPCCCYRFWRMAAVFFIHQGEASTGAFLVRPVRFLFGRCVAWLV